MHTPALPDTHPQVLFSMLAPTLANAAAVASVRTMQSSLHHRDAHGTHKDSDTDDFLPLQKTIWVIFLHVLTVFFLWLRCLGFLRGTGIKMATFILMIQDISWNIDTFLVVLFLILLMFATLYHILLADSELQDDEWGEFGSSLWKGT